MNDYTKRIESICFDCPRYRSDFNTKVNSNRCMTVVEVCRGNGAGVISRMLSRDVYPYYCDKYLEHLVIGQKSEV